MDAHSYGISASFLFSKYSSALWLWFYIYLSIINTVNDNVTGAGKTLTRESQIIVAFSIITLLYSLFIGQLLLGLIVIFLVVILLRLIQAGE